MLKPVTKGAARLLHEGSIALAEVEHNGVRVDEPYLDSQIDRVGRMIRKKEQQLREDKTYREWRKRFGDKTKLGSREQLATVVFDCLGYERAKTASKKRNDEEGGRRESKQNEEAFSKVDLPFVKQYFSMEKLKKLQSTYLLGIKRELVNGFVHPSYNLHTVVSYRSCIAKGTMIEVVRDLSKSPDGIRIEDVRAGDFVYCYDDNLKLTIKKVLWAGKTGHRKVIRLHWSARGKHGHLDLTPEHRVRMATGEYVQAKDIMVGDFRAEGETRKNPKRRTLAMGRGGINNHKIVKVEHLDDRVDVYDLEIEDCHNFIANEICVHNSCNMPNWQNVPARNQTVADIIRRCYIPRKGRQLIEIDYGQIEVRVAACYNHDKQLIRYINDTSTDMHRDMAEKLFLMEGYRPETDEAKKLMKKGPRDWSKNRFVFPEFYGSVYFQCAPHLWQAIESGAMHPDGKLTMKEHLRTKGIKRLGDCGPDSPEKPGTFVAQVKRAEDFLWNTTFKEYTAWKKRWYAEYLKTGGFNLHTGFRVEGLLGRNDVLNYSIQGSSFHCLLWSIIRMSDWLRENKMRTKIVGQIHDCVVFDAPPDEVKAVLARAQEVMVHELTKAWKWIIVPLAVEADITPIDGAWSTKAPCPME